MYFKVTFSAIRLLFVCSNQMEISLLYSKTRKGYIINNSNTQ